jgi:serine phosphatase RsbU (regulator of sigma subunit)
MLTLPGQQESGDKCLVQEFEGGAFLAVVDALGHGREAAAVADIAIKSLSNRTDETLNSLFLRCHLLMRGLRGVTMSLAIFDWKRQTLGWLGIGNVSGVVINADTGAHPRVQPLLVRSGVVGDHMPVLSPSVMPFQPGDMLVLTTDGVSPNFMEMLPSRLAPQALADQILKGYAKNNDDAAVLVLRMNGVK